MVSSTQKYIAEAFGTMVLVLLGCGSVVLSGYAPTFPLGILPVAFAFGIAVTGMAYGIGPISGCHINPAVSIGVWAAGRMSTVDMIGYWVSQVIGAVIGAAVLYAIASGKAGWDISKGLGANGFTDFSLTSVLLAEFVATMIFVVVILGATSAQGATAYAGAAIGLTLVAIHIVFVGVDGTSVNPARSIGPAIFVGGKALEQLWVFIAAPLAGGLVGGLLFKSGLFEPRA